MTNLFGKNKADVLDEYFTYWRKRGFPVYSNERYNKKREINTLLNFDEKTIYKDSILRQTMHSLGFLWSYFPHWVDVKYNDGKTIKELWEDDDKLKELLAKTYDYQIRNGHLHISVNRLRQKSKIYLSKQSVSNFRPTVAKWVYNTYGGNGTVWDMSCGWGGRLFGFFSSNCKKYIGTEPSINTFTGLIKLKEDFSYLGKEVELHNIGSEDFLPQKESIDLCFTSPPYFDTEKYCDEPTQSYIKFPDKYKWLNGFYKKTMWNCYDGLKEGGYMIINISNTPKYDFLETQTISIAKDLGFEHISTLKMELSSISGKGVKYEPVFIFKK